MASGRTHLSIGDVLSLVQAEFPDITISKIRFLESQGLLEPERTPSGYRKFYDQDIERLRWILAQQRDHFLPLKVIRERLQEWDESGVPPSGGAAVHPSGHAARRDAARVEDGHLEGDPLEGDPLEDDPLEDDPVDDSTPDVAEPAAPAAPPLLEAPADTAPPVPEGAGLTIDEADDPGVEPEAADASTASEPDVATSARPLSNDVRAAATALAAGSAMEVAPPPMPEPAPGGGADPMDADPTDDPDDAGAVSGMDVSDVPSEGASERRTSRDWHPVGVDDEAMTAEELAERAGVPLQVVEDLVSFSMISSNRVGPDVYYDASALRVATACRAFLDHGIEVRHLRMYKIAAEREAGVFEQVVMPLLKQRNPTAKVKAIETVTALADVGEELHAALLRAALAETLG